MDVFYALRLWQNLVAVVLQCREDINNGLSSRSGCMVLSRSNLIINNMYARGPAIYFASSSAQLSVLGNLPRLRTNRLGRVQKSARVVLRLDAQESLVLGPEENVLEVGLLEVTLVEVRAGARRRSLDDRNDGVGHEFLVREHLVPVCRVEGPDGRQRGVHESTSPCGQHGVLLVGSELADVCPNADPSNTLLCDGAGSLVESCGIALHDRARDEPSTVLGDADLNGADGERSEVGIVVVVV